jgi:hypothetical protein
MSYAVTRCSLLTLLLVHALKLQLHMTTSSGDEREAVSIRVRRSACAHKDGGVHNVKYTRCQDLYCRLHSIELLLINYLISMLSYRHRPCDS